MQPTSPDAPSRPPKRCTCRHDVRAHCKYYGCTQCNCRKFKDAAARAALILLHSQELSYMSPAWEARARLGAALRQELEEGKALAEMGEGPLPPKRCPHCGREIGAAEGLEIPMGEGPREPKGEIFDSEWGGDNEGPREGKS